MKRVFASLLRPELNWLESRTQTTGKTMNKKPGDPLSFEQRVDRLFDKVSSLGREEASQFLSGVDESREVLVRVEALLESNLEETRLLTESDDPVGSGDRVMGDLSGLVVEGIKLIRLIGSGGMGEVYLGEDIRLKRQVAVKTIRGNRRLDEFAKERLRREAMILSSLDHPAICRIHSLLEEESIDFLVLEYVQGSSLGQWQDSGQTHRRKLRVAAEILEALSVAHQADVVHRDLKPDNIMILGQDEVKVLDFGISRILTEARPEGVADSSLDENLPSDVTIPGTVLGTLRFMSPEQANEKEVGTASDIFSLGIMFQELFSETLAHPPGLDRKTFVKRAKAGETNPVEGLPGDLARLIERMKSPVPAARPTAMEAASMLERIRTGPARRLRWGLVAVAVLIITGGIFKYLFDLRFEREQAEQARTEAVEVSEFLTSLFEVADPSVNKGETITARELLDEGAARIDTELAAQPGALARLKLAIGIAYGKLGLYDSARTQLEQAEAIVSSNSPSNPSLEIDIMMAIGLVAYEQHDLEETERRMTALAAALADDPIKQAHALSQLGVVYAGTERYSQALEIQNQALEIFRSATGEDLESGEVGLINTYNNIGQLYWRQDILEEAEINLREALARYERYGIDDLDLESAIRSNLANVLGEAGKMAESAAFAESAVQIRQRIHGEDHPSLALAYDNLAVALFKAGDMESAAKWNLAALDVYAATTGKDNTDYAWTLTNRSVVLRELGDLAGSEAALNEVLATMRSQLGAVHSDVAYVLEKLGLVLMLREHFPQAASAYGEAVAIYTELEKEYSPGVIGTWQKLAEAQHRAGQNMQAKETLDQLLANLESGESGDPELVDEIRAQRDAIEQGRYP
jgi:serine/threonine-protein kinase